MKTSKVKRRRRFWAETLADSNAIVSTEVVLEAVEPNDFYNLYSSLIDFGDDLDELHAPIIDVDIPCNYIKSSTKGHGHLEFPSLQLTWDEYENLLSALCDAGIVSEAWLAHSRNRRMTTVRPRWIRKINSDRAPKPWPKGVPTEPTWQQRQAMRVAKSEARVERRRARASEVV